MELVAMLEMEDAVTLRRMGAERTNLTQNHPLGSYKHDRITRRRSGRVPTATEPSGNFFPLNLTYLQ